MRATKKGGDIAGQGDILMWGHDVRSSLKGCPSVSSPHPILSLHRNRIAHLTATHPHNNIFSSQITRLSVALIFPPIAALCPYNVYFSMIDSSHQGPPLLQICNQALGNGSPPLSPLSPAARSSAFPSSSARSPKSSYPSDASGDENIAHARASSTAVADVEAGKDTGSAAAAAAAGSSSTAAAAAQQSRAKQGEWNLVGLFHRSAVAQVACGVFHTMFLMQSSEVYAIGRGDWGLLGMGDRMDRKVPCKIIELQDQRVAYIACGLRHSAAVSFDGQLYTWGCGANGRLGLGDAVDSSVPQYVSFEHFKSESIKIARVACGYKHTLAMTETGVIFSCGCSAQGQLGVKCSSDRVLFDCIPYLQKEDIVSIAAGASHSVCLTANGELFTWGCNVSGQLGRAQGDGWGYPQLVPTLMGIRISQIGCGGAFTVALSEHGVTYAWGSNSHGQLGSMSPSRLSFVAQPRAIPKLVDFPVEIVSCGPATVVAMCARGHSDADLHSPLQAHQGGGGSPRTPIQSTSTPMWLGDLPYWKDGAQLNFNPKVNDLVWTDEDAIIDCILFSQ